MTNNNKILEVIHNATKSLGSMKIIPNDIKSTAARRQQEVDIHLDNVTYFTYTIQSKNISDHNYQVTIYKSPIVFLWFILKYRYITIIQARTESFFRKEFFFDSKYDNSNLELQKTLFDFLINRNNVRIENEKKEETDKYYNDLSKLVNKE